MAVIFPFSITTQPPIKKIHNVFAIMCKLIPPVQFHSSILHQPGFFFENYQNSGILILVIHVMGQSYFLTHFCR